MAQDVIWQQKEYQTQSERKQPLHANEFGHKQPGNWCMSSKRSHLRGRLPEIKTTDGEVTCVGSQKMKLGSKPLI